MSLNSITILIYMGSKGWRSGESARLPPMWPGFKSRRRRHIWVEFVVGSLPCSYRFFSGYSGFPLSSKANTSKFQFDQESGKRRTTMWMCYVQIVIYYYYYLFIILFIYLIFLSILFDPFFRCMLLSEKRCHCLFIRLFTEPDREEVHSQTM